MLQPPLLEQLLFQSKIFNKSEDLVKYPIAELSNMHLMSTDLRSKASVIPPHQKYPHICGTNSQIY